MIGKQNDIIGIVDRRCKRGQRGIDNKETGYTIEIVDRTETKGQAYIIKKGW
jgi:hypothetical protein